MATEVLGTPGNDRLIIAQLFPQTPDLDVIVQGLDGNDQIVSGGGQDQLYGDTSGVMLVEHASGNDHIAGGGGDDVVYGDDFLAAHGGKDRLYGQSGDDTIYGDALLFLKGGNDLIDGGDGNDTIWGDGQNGEISGNDKIYGGNGNDTIYGDGGQLDSESPIWATGNDRIDGGAGDDIIYGDNSPDGAVLSNRGNDTIHGGDGNDQIYGGGGNDKLYGDAGDDTIAPGSGDDRVYGGGGADAFVFQPDYNVLAGTVGHDTLLDFNTAEGDRIDLAAFGLSFATFDSNGDGVVGAGDEAVQVKGGSLLLDLDMAGVGYYQGLPNYDASGQDTILVKGVQDLTAAAFAPTDPPPLTGTPGDDTLSGTSHADTIFGFAGNDHIDGGQGDDLIVAGPGNDVVSDMSGYGVTLGGAGDDIISRDGGGAVAGGGVIDGGPGNDTIQFANGYFDARGGDGNDTIVTTGGPADGNLHGGAGDDLLSVVAAQTGGMDMTGDAGNDVFRVIYPGAQAVYGELLIEDFEAGHDRIEFGFAGHPDITLASLDTDGNSSLDGRDSGITVDQVGMTIDLSSLIGQDQSLNPILLLGVKSLEAGRDVVVLDHAASTATLQLSDLVREDTPPQGGPGPAPAAPASLIASAPSPDLDQLVHTAQHG